MSTMTNNPMPPQEPTSAASVEQLELDLQCLQDNTLKLVQGHRHNAIALLAFLRLLEKLHHEIRDGLFQAALPANRQALYQLLRDIELAGGWPYIPRMKLEAFLQRWVDSLGETDGEATQNSAEPQADYVKLHPNSHDLDHKN